MPSPWLALEPGIDPGQRRVQIARAHDRFVSTAECGQGIRDVVRDSWSRSAAGGVDADSLAPIEMSDDELRAYRESHPLAQSMPAVRKLISEHAIDADLLVAVCDAQGLMLWVEGPSRMRTAAESIHFMPGSRWGETSAGTNAPGTALAVDHAVQVFSHEHFARSVQPWSCTAAPIHDPLTGEMLGALDVTGGDEVATAQAMVLVQAAVYGIEADLRARATAHGARPVAPRRSAAPRLSVLGRHRAALTVDAVTTELSLRHSEMLLLLASHPAGLSSDQLAVALSDDDNSPVTIRAEMSRLRRMLGDLGPESRPYRLPRTIDTDVAAVRRLLHRGELARAIACYVGPVLPRSYAPGIEGIRVALEAEVRAAALSSPDGAHALQWASAPHGSDDIEAWSAAARRLPHGSREQAVARLRVASLDRTLGIAAGH